MDYAGMLRIAGSRATTRGMKKGQRRAKMGDVEFLATGNGHGVSYTAAKLLLGFTDGTERQYPPFDVWETFRSHYVEKTGKDNAQLTESRFRAIKAAAPQQLGILVDQRGRPVGIDEVDLVAWCARLK